MTFVLIIHLMIAIVLVTLVLMQQSEGGALGIGGGGGGGGGGFLTGRGTANLLTRLTAGFGAAFFATSVLLTLMATGNSTPQSRFDNAQPTQQQPAPGANQPAAPAPGSGGVLDKLKSGQGVSTPFRTPPAGSGN